MSAAIQRLNPRTLPDTSNIGYSQISIAGPGRLAFVSGQVAWRAEGGEVPGPLAAQTAVVIENLQAALSALDARPQQIVQMRVYLTELTSETQEVVMSQLVRLLDGARPSLTGVAVAALAAPDLQIEVEMVVQLPAEP